MYVKRAELDKIVEEETKKRTAKDMLWLTLIPYIIILIMLTRGIILLNYLI